VPAVTGDLGVVRVRTHPAVVDEHIEGSPCLRDLLDQPRDGFIRAKVQVGELSGPTGGAALLSDLATLRLIMSIGEPDIVSRSRQRDRDSGSNARARTGNKGSPCHCLTLSHRLHLVQDYATCYSIKAWLKISSLSRTVNCQEPKPWKPCVGRGTRWSRSTRAGPRTSSALLVRRVVWWSNGPISLLRSWTSCRACASSAAWGSAAT